MLQHGISVFFLVLLFTCVSLLNAYGKSPEEMCSVAPEQFITIVKGMCTKEGSESRACVRSPEYEELFHLCFDRSYRRALAAYRSKYSLSSEVAERLFVLLAAQFQEPVS